MKASLALLCFFSVFLFVGASNAQVGWSNPTTISDLRIFNGSSVTAETLDTEVSEACSAASTQFHRTQFVVDTENQFFPETYSILLTAQVTGRRVQLYRTRECHDDLFAIINGARLLD